MVTKTEAAPLTDVQIVEILARPYSWVVRPDESGVFTAKIAEFPGCIAEGETAEEALSNLREVARNWVRSSVASKYSIPAPSAVGARQSGKFLVRTTRSLHRKLMECAEREGVSLNQFASNALAEAVGMHTAKTTLHGMGITIVGEPLGYTILGKSGKTAATSGMIWKSMRESMLEVEAVSSRIGMTTEPSKRSRRRERSPDA